MADFNLDEACCVFPNVCDFGKQWLCPQLEWESLCLVLRYASSLICCCICVVKFPLTIILRMTFA